MVPTAVRCDSVMRTAHPSTDPTPSAVRINTRATKTAIPNKCGRPSSMNPTTAPNATPTSQPSVVAYAASRGADRGQSRRQRALPVSTDGKPRFKNQLSAAALAVACKRPEPPARRPAERRRERPIWAYPTGGSARVVAPVELVDAGQDLFGDTPAGRPDR